MTSKLTSFCTRLRRAEDGVAMIEFAYSMVIIVPLMVSGIELANYVVTTMRVNQLALHVADNASRIGTESLLAKPKVSDWQINDLLTGANMQAAGLGLATNGRVIISSVEPDPNNAGKFHIRWQRCYGAKTWPSSYGKAGDTNLSGVGPSANQVKAPDASGVMFVEVAYTYKPLIAKDFIAAPDIRATASMVVRDQRDFEGPTVSGQKVGVYNTENVAVATCPP